MDCYHRLGMDGHGGGGVGGEPPAMGGQKHGLRRCHLQAENEPTAALELIATDVFHELWRAGKRGPRDGED